MSLLRRSLCVLFLLCASLAGRAVLAAEPSLPRLKVSENHRFLVNDKNEPFFWLGDTAWELFHRLNRQEADEYLTLRSQQGYTVIQAVALAELDGHNVPNAYGYLPFEDLDPARPALTKGPDNDYWDHVDYVVNLANQRGMYVGFLPTWGRYWHDEVHNGKPLFNAANAETYGRWLGERYRDKGIVWILGGDRPVENDEQRKIIDAMARGLRAGDGGAHLMTFHPPGGRGSAEWFHDADWLDFNMRQNGHVAEFTERYAKTREDYDRQPVKPVLDGEPIYEDHPISFAPDKLGHSIAADVRKPLYWNLFTGAFGHTYGHHSVWQMYSEGKNPINRPLMPWKEAILQPGAAQMRHGRRLIESRPQLDRIPDDDLIVPASVPSSVPGAGRYRFVATRDVAGSYAMIYVPTGRSFTVRMNKITGPEVTAWWYNPRDGHADSLGSFPNEGERAFISPNPGEDFDWVLVLDDASKSYPPPGTVSRDK
jgi:hypothetical protein